ncbi:MAG: ATP-dependent Clp protease ATP-binding subunit [bacterium]|nr:ATP-dependent Clp protease ATP-binding subunit [bacterium]
MFSRFTEKAIQAIMLAQEEAKKFNHNYVGTEHILLGILSEGDNNVTKTLKEMGFNASNIKLAIEDKLEFSGSTIEQTNIPFTQQAKQMLTAAWDESRRLGHNYVNIEHLFLSIFRDPNSIASKLLEELGITADNFRKTLFNEMTNDNKSSESRSVAHPTPTLDLFGRDLTALAKNNKLDPIIGRDNEVNRMIQILCRRNKNNPVLTGEPGVGKTAVVEGLAQRLLTDFAPEKLKTKRIISLDLGLLVAGTKYRGEFEERVKKIMEETHKAKNIVLFIDELHTIIGTGGSEGSLDAANLLKPALARGELQCIGATTLEEYRKHIEQDGALERRFQSILVEAPTKANAVEILKGIKKRYEDFHGVQFTDEAIEKCVELSVRYITDRNLPDKAVDLMDESAAKIMIAFSKLPPEIQELSKSGDGDSNTKAVATPKSPEQYQQYCVVNRIVDTPVINEVLSIWTGIDIKQLTEKETERIKNINQTLKRSIIGQDSAVDSISRAVKRSKLGLKDPKRPIGSFLFLGPTGVGKSELAKQLALFLFGDVDALIRIDMSEFMEKHSVSRLIGAPPGYVGFNEGGELTEPIRRKPYSVVLFDEIEKASPDVMNILLQILEDGRLTDSSGRVVNFKNTIIILTSNVGSQFIETSSTFGFQRKTGEATQDKQNIEKKIGEELLNSFKPELLNRIDDTIIFGRLDRDSLLQIIDIMLQEIQTRLKSKNITIRFDDSIKSFLVDKGFNKKQGARPLRRSLQTHFEDVLVDTMLDRGVKEDISASAKLNKEKDEIVFSIRKKQAKKKTPVKRIAHSNQS